MQSTQPPAERPDHVPAELVRDIDLYNIPGANEDVHLGWKKMANSHPPIFWTPRNGGHWFATRADDIEELQRNHEDFSMTAATIPRQSTPSLPVESDPPYHTGLRAIISPLFSPEVLKSVQERARALTIEIVEKLKPKGRCEFVNDFARHLPIFMFLGLVDLPFKDKDKLLALAEIRFRSPDKKAREDAKEGLLEYMRASVEERRLNPGTDFLSQIIHARIDDRVLRDDERENLLATVLSGGLDTVAASMGFAMRFLAMHPEHRQQLIDDPKLIPNAVDELIRRHGIANTARLVTHDMEFRGVKLKKGEQIMGPPLLYGLSDDKFDDALTVDFKRPNAARHAAFGNGPHRCPGANLARLELRLMLEEWLPRIPDFRLDPNNPPVMMSGIANSVLSMHLIWND